MLLWSGPSYLPRPGWSTKSQTCIRDTKSSQSAGSTEGQWLPKEDRLGSSKSRIMHSVTPTHKDRTNTNTFTDLLKMFFIQDCFPTSFWVNLFWSSNLYSVVVLMALQRGPGASTGPRELARGADGFGARPDPFSFLCERMQWWWKSGRSVGRIWS